MVFFNGISATSFSTDSKAFQSRPSHLTSALLPQQNVEIGNKMYILLFEGNCLLGWKNIQNLIAALQKLWESYLLTPVLSFFGFAYSLRTLYV